MLIHGKCHCGNIAFVLDWPGDSGSTDVVARQCGCSFCVKHRGAWTSNRSAKLLVTLRRRGAVSRYMFGTETAVFYVCTRCGAVPMVTSEIENHVYAVVNVNTFENLDSMQLRRQPINFDGEEQQLRLARRQKNWIADVHIAEGAA
jgi:hypothetical protein